MEIMRKIVLVLLLLIVAPIPVVPGDTVEPAVTDQGVMEQLGSLTGNSISTKNDVLDILANGTLPKWYTGKYMAMSSSPDPVGDEYLPPLDLGEKYLHFVRADSVREVKEGVYNPAISTMILDRRMDLDSPDVTPQENSGYFQDVSNTQRVNNELNITGRDVVIGITDTGIDFGNTELSSAMQRLPSGISASFDPTGSGLAATDLSVQAETVDGVTYLPLEGKSVIFWGADQQSYINSTSVGIQLNNIEITGISQKSKSGTYKVGIAYAPFFAQQQINSYFIFVLVDSVDPTRYDTLYIDMDTSFGISLALNDFIFEAGSLYRELVDWSLNDEVPYGNDNPILAYDWDGDGVNDFSLGALASTLDLAGVVDQGLVQGIDPIGGGFAFISDAVGHGTMTASAAAGRGIVKFPIYDNPETDDVENSTLYTIPGSAPDAMIISTKGYQLTDFLIGWLWVAGLEPTLTEWRVNRDHLVDISSNSWGDGSHLTELKSVDFFSFFLDGLSTPNFFDVLGSSFGVTYSDYPGISFVVSMGNGGPGFGTIASPGAASLAFTVGASTSFLEYGWTQKDDVALFSGEGPTPLGYVKPDAVALGSFGYVTEPLAAAKGNGSIASRTFGGTSEAGPRAAGMFALMYEALRSKGQKADLGTVRTILKSTAKDLGFDPVTQGAGLLDAYSAVSSALGGPQIIVRDYQSPVLIGERMNDGFNLLFGVDHPLLNGSVPDSAVMVDPAALADGRRIELVYGNGTVVPSASASLSFLDEIAEDTFSITTRSDYNRSIPGSVQIDQSTVLLEVITSLTEESNDQLLRTGLSAPAIRLVNSEGVFVAEAYTTAYSTVFFVGFPFEDMDSTLRFLITDPGYENGVTGWQPLNYEVTVRQYVRTAWDIASYNSTDLVGDFDEQDYRTGVLSFSSGGVTTAMIPLAYAPVLNVGFMDGADFLGDQVADNFFYELDETLPSWNWLGSTARPEAGDHRFYYLDVPHNATFLAISVQWNVNPLLPNLYLYDTNGTFFQTSDVQYLGSGYYTGSTSSEFAQNMIVPTSGGRYVLETHVTETPFSSEPVELKVLARYLTIESLPDPSPDFSQDINGTVTGDLVIDASGYSVAQLPEIEVDRMSLAVYQETNTTIQQTLKLTDLEKGPGSPEITLEKKFVKGEKVTMVLNWTTQGSVDLDLMVMYNGVDVLNGLGTTPSAAEEVVTFGVKEAGEYSILIDFINGSTFSDIDINLFIDSRNGPIFRSNSPDITLSSDLFPNQLYLIELTVGTNFGVEFVLEYVVFMDNHRAFDAKVLTPTSGETLSGEVVLSWEAPDNTRTTIEVRMSDTTYSVATEVRGNTYTLDTTRFPDGQATIRFTITDGFSKRTFEINVIIDNGNTNTLPPYNTVSSTRPIPFASIGLVALIFMRRKRNKND